jgi:hypothetical protein
MAEKQKSYQAKFPPEVIEQAYSVFCSCLEENAALAGNTFEVNDRSETWNFDSKDDFYVEYRKYNHSATLSHTYHNGIDLRRFYVSYREASHFQNEATTIAISLASKSDIERVFGIFEENYEKYKSTQDAKTQPSSHPSKQESAMELTGAKSIRHAILAKQEHLKLLDTFLQENFSEIDYKATCNDGTKLSVANLDRLLEYENPDFRKLDTITIEAAEALEERAWDVKNYIQITLGEESNLRDRSGRVLLSFSDTKTYNFVENETLKLIKVMRPWYSPLTQIQFRYWLIFSLSFLAIVWATAYYTGELFGFWTVVPTSSPALLSAAKGFYQSVGILAILFSVGYLIDRIREYLFPRCFFCIGGQLKAFETRQRIANIVLTVILLGFIVSIAAGLVVNRFSMK